MEKYLINSLEYINWFFDKLVYLWGIVYAKLMKVIFATITFFSPVNFIFFLIGFSIIVDTFFGRWSARKIAEREGKDVRLVVTSKRTREGITSKMLTYNIIIGMLFTMDYYLFNTVVTYYAPKFPINFIVTKLIGCIFVLIEIDSIDEKYYLVTGKRLKTKITEITKSLKGVIVGIFNFSKDLKK